MRTAESEDRTIKFDSAKQSGRKQFEIHGKIELPHAGSSKNTW